MATQCICDPSEVFNALCQRPALPVDAFPCRTGFCPEPGRSWHRSIRSFWPCRYLPILSRDMRRQVRLLRAGTGAQGRDDGRLDPAYHADRGQDEAPLKTVAQIAAELADGYKAACPATFSSKTPGYAG